MSTSTRHAHEAKDAAAELRPAGGIDEQLYDVAIVGLGPSGVTAANFAGMLGLRTIVIEKDADVFPRQRAIALDDEVMRIFQSIGLVEPIRATMHEGLTMTFVTNRGKEFLRLAPEISDNGYWQQNFFHQPWLEAELRKGAARFSSQVEILLGWSADAVVNHDDHATVDIVAVDGDDRRSIRARYVLGCDGGSSAIRKSLGFDMGGVSYAEQWMDVQGELLERVPGTPHFKFICDPQRPGVDCPCPGGMHRYEWRIPKDEDPVESQRREVLWPTLKAFSKMATSDPGGGIDESHLDIQRTWEYTFHVRNCERWKIGRVFLLGDAAHIMPPFAGQGMSAGMRDAANILWKMRLVLDGRADEELLDTYQDERQKHVAEMTKFSQALGGIVMIKNPVLARLRDLAFLAIRRVPGLRQYTLSMKARPAPAISAGFVSPDRGRRSATGRPFPNVDVGTKDGRMLIDDALGYGLVVLGMDCDPRDVLPAHTVEGWERLGARFVRIRSGTLLVGESEIGDPVGRLYDWFLSHRSRVAVVRPDRMVYGVDGAGVDLTPPHVTAKAPVGAQVSA